MAQFSKSIFHGKLVAWEEFVSKSVLAKIESDVSRIAVKEAIAKMFESVTAYVLELPTSNVSKMKNIASKAYSNMINPEIFKEIKEVKYRVRDSSQLKKIEGGSVSVEAIKYLCNLYLAGVNEQCDKPQMDTVWDSTVKLQLDQKQKKYFLECKNEISNITFPCSVEHVDDCHNTALKEAKHLFESSKNRFDASLKKLLGYKLLEAMTKELQKRKEGSESMRYCQKSIGEFMRIYYDMSDSNLGEMSCDGLNQHRKELLQVHQLQVYLGEAKETMMHLVYTKHYECLEKILCTCCQRISKSALQIALETNTYGILKIHKLPCKTDENGKKYNEFSKINLEISNKICNNCSDCEECRKTLANGLATALEKRKQQNEEKPQQHCDNMENSLIRKHILRPISYPRKPSYYDFLVGKQKTFDEYKMKGKGPLKAEVKEKCIIDIETKLTVPETQTVNCVRNDATIKHEKDTSKLIEREPLDGEELTESVNIFQRKRRDVLKSDLAIKKEILKMILEDKQKNFTFKIKEIFQKFNGKQIEDCLRNCEKGFNAIAKNVEYKEWGQDTENLNQNPESTQITLQQNYHAKLVGPSKEGILERLQCLMKNQLTTTKRVNVETLIRSLEACIDNKEGTGAQGPYKEREILEMLKAAVQRPCSFYQSGYHTFDYAILKQYLKILQMIANHRPAQLIMFNYKQSIKRSS
ncbi:hypothetical protein HOLleu_43542 [Holothuria leucospilota]|uniref:Uncharacterized protein n=1 Tax=Holothuria leucospilota TaxID=206669 RepID=A0A9Q0YBH0_HOLLE|nr:hypothetical protein HOLleu_43542 [Holothuria leucospilota]